MNKKIILLITIPLILLIAFYPIFSANSSEDNNTTINKSSAEKNVTENVSQSEKVAFIIPHPDDETIGVG
jgi:hypothetical protein